jgi:hypothetical protein
MTKPLGNGKMEGLRVGCSINNFKMLLNKDYETFVSRQTKDVLKKEMFETIAENVQHVVKRQEAMIAILVVHDLLKVHELQQKFFGKVMSGADHDKLLAQVLVEHVEEFPTLVKLSTEDRKLVIATLSEHLDLLQFVQGELDLQGLERIVNVFRENFQVATYYKFFALLDLSGAAGHVDKAFYGSIVLNQPTMDCFWMAVETINTFCINKTVTPRFIYKRYLKLRWEAIGTESSHWIDLTENKIGIQRLVCLSRFYGPGYHNVLITSLASMNEELVLPFLNRLSNLEHPIMYYSPQLIVDHTSAPLDGTLKEWGKLDPSIRDQFESEDKNDAQVVSNAFLKNKIDTLINIYTLLAECYKVVSDIPNPSKMYNLLELVNFCKGKPMNDLPMEVVVNDDKIFATTKRYIDDDEAENPPVKRVKSVE